MRKETDYTFEWAVLKHLDAAYNLARWLLGNDQDAEDIVQEAAIRAYNSLKSLRGAESKPWFLTIVRNTSYNLMRRRTSQRNLESAIEESLSEASPPSPEGFVIKAWEAETVRAAIDELPIAYREVVVLRELEGMSYKQIASITGLPIGTVMSRLARARQRLQASLMAAEAP